MGIWYFFSSSFLASTHLLHDAGLSLGKGDVTTRLVADELDLDLAALASALLVVVVIVVGRARSLALDSAIFASGGAIADGVRVVEIRGRRIFVMIGDVGHSQVSRENKKGKAAADEKGKKWWRCCFEPCADGLYWIWSFSGEAPSSLLSCRRNLVGRSA